MRLYSFALISLVLPAAASAQGRLIPRPCALQCSAVPECGQPRPAVNVVCGGRLERISNNVRAVLTNRVLQYEVTEVFRNSGGRVAEADYIFPLPAGAAFEDLKLSINGELVAGETMGADKARGIYEEIVRRQRDPALVEWMGAGMLRTRIFPIAPGEEKTVVVRYQSVAQREGDALRIDYRRGSDPERGVAPQVSDSRPRRGPADGEAGGTWSRFSLQYASADAYGEPYSPTHTLKHRTEGSKHIVEARGEAGDFTVLLPIRRSNSASMSVLTHANTDEPGFALIAVSPPAESANRTPRDLTFVVDVSGSMIGKKLEQAKAAGHTLLQSLREGDRFRIIDFSTDVREFRDDVWTSVDDASMRAARKYLDELRAEGSTNISEALTVALEAPPSASNRLPLVVFVTDGEPTIGLRNTDAITALAAKKRKEARVFTVGVTTGINAALVEQLALEGRGTAHFVRNDESVESAVSLLARRLAAPVLTNVTVTAQGVKLTQLLPAGPIDVFAGQDLVLLARYTGEGDATIRLEGTSPDGPVSWTTTAQFRDREKANPFVARLWAAQRIGWLAAEKRRNGGSAELNDEIKQLGERYGIPTEYSSYLVLEPGMTVGNSVLPEVRRGQVGAQSAPPPVATTAAGGRGVGTGTGTAVGAAAGKAAGNAAPPSSADSRFEAARTAAEQRSARSTATLDASLNDATARLVGGRRFTLENGVWRDAKLSDSMRQVRVKPYSTLYFELMKRIDELAQPFALGDRVMVAGRAVAISLDAAGLDTMDEAQLQVLLRDWK